MVDTDVREQPRHPMAVVCRRTGLKPDLLRAWERRYGVVRPSRSQTGRRLYTDADIERLLLLKRAVDGGRPIGLLVRLDRQQVEELIAADDAARLGTPAAALEAGHGSSGDALLDACLTAIQSFDTGRLSYELERASHELGRRALIDRLIAPLLRGLGERWQQGVLGPAHEHAATAVLRTFLGALPTPPDGETVPKLVVTTPAGELHELGALLAASTAASEGWSVLYLGPNLPAEEIAAAAEAVGARAILLSMVQDGGTVSARELERLTSSSGEQRAVIVGGRAAGHHAALIRRRGGRLIDDLAGLRAALAELA
jgi:DNA-binding transcriptional MerR regulator/methylmalonyl-CoA mutase cobalamin-binding subunit